MLNNVLLRGELGDNQSCGIVNIGLCYGFERNNVNVSIDPKSMYGSIPKFAHDRIRRKLIFDTVIEHGLPYQMQGLGKNRPWKRVALNFWDSDLITKEAADCLNEYADKIIVHSQFNKKGMIDAGVEKEIIVGGYAVFTELYRNIEKKPKDKFRFIFTGVAQGRKGVQEAISGFEEVLGDKKDVELVIKSNSWGKLSDYTVKSDNVIRIYEEFPRGNLIELMANADAYVCLSKGDGFHGGGCEAMACGLPLIMTDFGGPTEYCNEKTGYPLKYKLFDCHYLPGHQAEPDMEHYKETLLHVYNNQEEAKSKGMYGYKWAQEYWDWEHDCKRLIKALEGTND